MRHAQEHRQYPGRTPQKGGDEFDWDLAYRKAAEALGTRAPRPSHDAKFADVGSSVVHD